MPKLPYTQYVQNRVAAFGVGTPILVRDLGTDIAAEYGMDEKKANAAAAVAVKRIMEAGTIPELRRIGVVCSPCSEKPGSTKSC